MTSTTRIPQSRDHRPLRRRGEDVQQEDVRHVPESLGVMWHNPAGAQGSHGARPEVRRSGTACDENLKSFAHMAVASPRSAARWCLDLGYFHGAQRGPRRGQGARDPALAGVRRVHPAGAGGPGVRRGDEQTPPTVTDEMSARLLDQLGAAGAGRADRRGSRSRTCPPGRNVALGIESAGLRGVRAACRAAGGAAERRSVAGMTDDPFVTHRSLLFTVAYEMLGSAADAEDVVQETWLRWADLGDAGGRGARPAGLPGADRHPAGAQPAAHAGPPARGLRRRVAARAAADQPGRGRGRRARRERLDRDAHRAGDAGARPSGRCSCCARCSTSRTTRSPTAVGKSPAAVRQIAHRAREHVAARRPRMQVSRTEQQAGRGAVPGRGARPATCRA